MRFLFALTTLSSILCIGIQAKPLAPDQSEQIESVIFVNGKARKANYSISKTKKALFSRKKYTQKKLCINILYFYEIYIKKKNLFTGLYH